MPLYTYKTVDKKNKMVGGSISAPAIWFARKKLEKQGQTIIFLVRDENSFGLRKLMSYISRFSKPDQIAFFRNLATMLGAGVPIAETLRVISGQTKSRRAKKVINEMVTDISNGKQLSSAMKKHPELFTPFLMETVNVGEISGRLNKTLERISGELEHDYELQREVQSQLAYPLVVITVMFAVLILMTTYVLPKIATLFLELNLKLPLPTRVLLAGGLFLQKYLLFIFIGFAVLMVLMFFILKSKKVEYLVHNFFLHLPIFGEIIRESNLVFFFRSLESLMASGVSFPRAVEVSEKTLTNDVYQAALRQMYPLLLQGIPFSDALKPFPYLFPAEAQSIIEVGGRTGKLEESFVYVTNYYERSLKIRARTITALIEPILMLVVGFAVGFIALSIFLPIYQTAYTNMI